MNDQTKIHHASSAGNAAELLATLEGVDRRRVAGVLLALASSLLNERAEPQPDPGEWLTLEQARAVLGLEPSRGKDKFRSTKDHLERLAVDTTKIGRSLLVRRDALDAALARVVTRKRAPVEATEDPAERSLARAGLRVVGRR